uniref:Uncharacterized protein n=1 Tax=Romanomermis culicivorax TaxID=13658 RepID=A0A915HIP7_ROMCU
MVDGQMTDHVTENFTTLKPKRSRSSGGGSLNVAVALEDEKSTFSRAAPGRASAVLTVQAWFTFFAWRSFGSGTARFTRSSGLSLKKRSKSAYGSSIGAGLASTARSFTGRAFLSGVAGFAGQAFWSFGSFAAGSVGAR